VGRCSLAAGSRRRFGYNRFRIAMIPKEVLLWDGSEVAIEIKGGLIVNERGTVVTFRQRCEACGYVFDWNKTTIVPAFGSRKVRPFTCPQCGNYQEVVARHYDPNRR
jgi:rubredoxin